MHYLKAHTGWPFYGKFRDHRKSRNFKKRSGKILGIHVKSGKCSGQRKYVPESVICSDYTLRVLAHVRFYFWTVLPTILLQLKLTNEGLTVVLFFSIQFITWPTMHCAPLEMQVLQCLHAGSRWMRWAKAMICVSLVLKIARINEVKCISIACKQNFCKVWVNK